MDQTFRKSVLKFVAEFYEERDRAPSIREIARGLRTYIAKIYNGFPGGISEMCELAGIPEPIERVRKIEPALKRNAEPNRVEKNLGKDVKQTETKYTFEAYVKDRRAKYRRLESDAKMDPKRVPEYARDVISKTNPDLWTKLNLLTDDVDNFVLEALSLKPSYLELVDASILKKESLPDFQKYVEDFLLNALNRAIELGLGAKARPVIRTGICPECQIALKPEKGGGWSFRCMICDKKYVFPCFICEEKMVLYKPDILKCPKCGFKSKLNNIDLNYVCYCALNNIDDPKLKGYSLDMVYKYCNPPKVINIHTWL